MSKFDAAIHALNLHIIDTESEAERYPQITKELSSIAKEYRAAIRVLEAAAKVDKNAMLGWVGGGEARYEGHPIQRQLRSLIESLPDDTDAKEKA